MLISVARAGRAFVANLTSRVRPARSRRRPVSFRTQVEPLEGRALLAAGAGQGLTVASYWVGGWKVNSTDLLSVGELPPHHRTPPALFMAYDTNFFQRPGTPLEGYRFVVDPKVGPDAATLTGTVVATLSGAKVGRFTLHATPNPNYATVPDSFTGQYSTGAGTFALHGTNVGENYEPGFWISGWGLPRERPIGGGGSTSPPGHLAVPHMFPPGTTTVVSDTVPTYRWTAVAGATSYELVVTDITPGIRPSLAKQFDETVDGTAFTPAPQRTLNPAHYYDVKVRANDGAGATSAWSNGQKFKIAEQKSRFFRIRVDKGLELSGFANYSRFVFTIQALEDSQGRNALGPPRVLIFRGPGVGLPTKLPIGISGETSWDVIETPTAMTVDDLVGHGLKPDGGITLYPSWSFGPKGSDTTMRLEFATPWGNFTQKITVNGWGFGVTLATQYAGWWSVFPAPKYDPSLWPNSLNP
jgi:hypothetical protein